MNGRNVPATAAGVLCGVVAFAGLLLAGLLLYQRLWNGSTGSLVVIAIVFGAIGAYAGWLLGLIVFSAVRGPLGEGADSNSADGSR